MTDSKPFWANVHPDDKDYGGEDVVSLALAIHNEQIVGWRDITTGLYQLLEIHNKVETRKAYSEGRKAGLEACLEVVHRRMTGKAVDVANEIRALIAGEEK